MGFLARKSGCFCSPFMRSTYRSSYGTDTSSSIQITVAARENGWW